MHRFENASFLVVETDTFENGDVKRFQSKSDHLPKEHMRNPRSKSFTSFSSVLVWIGENDTKTQVWIKI